MYDEKLSWILDNEDKSIPQNERYRQDIEFVHSLGLKCDCVGWSSLNLKSSCSNEILADIDKFCKEKGWKARGWYERYYTESTSDWYEIVPSYIKEITNCFDNTVYDGVLGEKVELPSIKAYHELTVSPKYGYRSILVPERFRDTCLRHNVTDVDFVWVKDKGKYKAEQYFAMYCNRLIPNILVSKYRKFDCTDKQNAREKLEEFGGYLPLIAEIFYNIQRIDLQDCYLKSEMPNCNFAYTLIKRPYIFDGKTRYEYHFNYLIRKEFAEILLEENAISKSSLRPAHIVSEVLGGYEIAETIEINRPISDCIKQSISEYEKHKNTPRPIRAISEKDGLRILRSAKKERKEDFKKKISKTLIPSLAETKYAPLVPYYLIANGGFLSDEYELLSYDDACVKNAKFQDELQAEELLEQKPDGVVIAICTDGDRVILCADGSVIRFSHEEPSAVDEWKSLAQFIADGVAE